MTNHSEQRRLNASSGRKEIKMKKNQMTLAEFLAWKHGELEDYQRLITRRRWLISRVNGASERKLDAEISMSCFGDHEHEDERYLRYKAEHDKETAKMERWLADLAEVERSLLPFVTNTDPEGSDMVEDRADMDWLAVPEE